MSDDSIKDLLKDAETRMHGAVHALEIPGDRRIARLSVFEATRKASALSPVLLGSVAVPAP